MELLAYFRQTVVISVFGYSRCVQ